MQKGTLLHVGLGLLSLLLAIIGMHILQSWGLGPLLAYTATAVGIVYEFQQWLRKEGTVDALDVVATAIPGFVAWLILEFCWTI